MKSKDCEVCKWRDDCVNVDKFRDGDCLQYEGELKKKGKKESEDGK